jgi:hypothetical protein
MQHAAYYMPCFEPGKEHFTRKWAESQAEDYLGAAGMRIAFDDSCAGVGTQMRMTAWSIRTSTTAV